MTQPLIEFKNLSKTYRTEEIETLAVNEVDLHVYPGEYLVIQGPSGGGKSTLLSVMGLLDAPTGGQYLFKGQDITQFNRAQLAKLRNQELGFVFQAFNLIEGLSVYDNVALPLRYQVDVTAPELKERVENALKAVGMDHRLKHFPTQLSGGQQQRVAIARAMVGCPSIILADEPTGNLDSKSAETVMALLKQQHESGVTVCIVTHDPRYTVDATRSVTMLDGKAHEDAQLGQSESSFQ